MPLPNLAPAGRTAPPKLTGVFRTRAEARAAYGVIVGEIRCCGDHDMLAAYLATIAAEVAAYKAELPFFWDGDGDDFPGLAREIATATERFGSDPDWLTTGHSVGSQSER